MSTAKIFNKDDTCDDGSDDASHMEGGHKRALAEVPHILSSVEAHIRRAAAAHKLAEDGGKPPVVDRDTCVPCSHLVQRKALQQVRSF